MKKLYVIEVKVEKNSNETIIISNLNNSLAVYEFKKVAKDEFVKIYEEYKERLLKLGVKPTPKNKFVIKEYVLKE